jgi:Flp pilus assembly CpaF family ATPase
VILEPPPTHEDLAALVHRPWPDLPDGIGDMATRFARVIEERRRGSGLPPSVREEETLEADVEALIEQVIESPLQYGVQPMIQDRLRRDDRFRAAATEATKVRASKLWPLSRLLYLVPELEEIHCFRWDRWVLTAGGQRVVLSPVGGPFSSDEEIIAFFRDRVLSLAGMVGAQHLNDAAPIAEATVGGVIRLIVAIRPAIYGDAAVQATIRTSVVTRVRSLDDYVSGGVMPPGVAEFLAACIRGRCNMIIAGGTATGKTTLLRVLAGMIPEHETVVVIEDSAELHLESDRGDGPIDPASGARAPRPWVPLCVNLCTVPSVLRSDSAITMRELVKAALRFRPDRILLGESRGAEMADVCTAMSTGHDGSLVTIHADSAFQAVERAANYVMESPRFSNNSRSYDLAKHAVHQAIDVVIHLTHAPGGARRVSGIAALGEAVDHSVAVYATNAEGILRRVTQPLGDLPPRLAARLHHHLHGDEVPYA